MEYTRIDIARECIELKILNVWLYRKNLKLESTLYNKKKSMQKLPSDTWIIFFLQKEKTPSYNLYLSASIVFLFFIFSIHSPLQL